MPFAEAGIHLLDLVDLLRRQRQAFFEMATLDLQRPVVDRGQLVLDQDVLYRGAGD